MKRKHGEDTPDPHQVALPLTKKPTLPVSWRRHHRRRSDGSSRSEKERKREKEEEGRRKDKDRERKRRHYKPESPASGFEEREIERVRISPGDVREIERVRISPGDVGCIS